MWKGPQRQQGQVLARAWSSRSSTVAPRSGAATVRGNFRGPHRARRTLVRLPTVPRVLPKRKENALPHGDLCEGWATHLEPLPEQRNCRDPECASSFLIIAEWPSTEKGTNWPPSQYRSGKQRGEPRALRMREWPQKLGSPWKSRPHEPTHSESIYGRRWEGRAVGVQSRSEVTRAWGVGGAPGGTEGAGDAPDLGSGGAHGTTCTDQNRLVE